MNYLRKFIDQLPSLEGPYAVKLLTVKPSISVKTLIEKEGPLEVHRQTNHFNLYLFLGQRTFQLCHVSTSMKAAVLDLLKCYKEKLIILCEVVFKDMFNPLPELVKVCEIIRTDKSDWSPLHVAVKAELSGIYSCSELRPWLNSRDRDFGETPLHLSIRLKLETIADELSAAGTRSSEMNNSGDTVIHFCVKYGLLNLLVKVCKRTDNLHRVINLLNLNGESPLHFACKYGDQQAAKTLLEFNADLFSQSKTGLPLHYALKFKQTEIVKLMLAYNPGAVFVACNKHGALPLHWCKTHADAELLFDHDSPLNYSSKTGDHPLHIMSKRGRLDVAISLVLKNVEMNAQGNNGNTPLHVAVSEGQVSLVKMLLLFGADHTLENDFNETPYLLAIRSNKPKRKEITQMLSNESSEQKKSVFESSSSQTLLGFVNDNVNKMSINKEFFQRPKLLCLDGGGIRGLVLTQILIEIEKQTGKRVKDLFDWISGTSTGGILAIALAQGKSAVYCQRLYFTMKDKVFVGSKPYNVEPLEQFLKEEFGEKSTMSSLGSNTKLMIPATLADRRPVQLHKFRNYSIPSCEKSAQSQFNFSSKLGKTDIDRLNSNLPPEDQLLWKVARCTGAAPTFFDSHDGFLDGGLISNNPTLDAMTEIHQFYKYNHHCLTKSKKLGLVLSLGTGQNPTTKVRSLDMKFSANPAEMIPSIFGAYELKNVLVDTITEANSFVLDRAKAWCESQDTKYYRLNPFLEEEISLDEVDDKKLLDLLWSTQIYVRENLSTIREIVQLLV